MIDIIVSNNLCPACDAQKAIMQKSFFKEEYSIIEVGSEDFEKYDLKERIEAVPFIVVRDEDGKVKYAGKGKLDGTSLHQIERVGAVVQEDKPKMLAKEAIGCVAGRLSRSMDS